MTFGRAVFGDNQFLGVDHSNQARAQELYVRFSDPHQIIEILGVAYESGIRDFMFTTHERYDVVFEEIRRSNLFRGMYYTPCIPYAHKYWDRLSSDGFLSAIVSPVRRTAPLSVIPAALGLLMGRSGSLISLLTRIETLMCRGLPVRGIFLQNAVMDLLLAFERYRELEEFASIVLRIGAEPGFVTMNHPLAAHVLTKEIGLDFPWICSNYNASGSRMNPSQEAVCSSFATASSRNMAMAIFAASGGSHRRSLDYVLRAVDAKEVDAVLFGSSTASNIEENADSILSR